MGRFLTRLNRVVLLFKNCPSTSRTLLFNSSNSSFLPHHTPRMRLLSVVFFFTGIPPRPLMISLGSKALSFATLFRPFLASLFCLDRLVFVKRSFFTLSGCSPCVKSGNDSAKTCSAWGAPVTLVASAVRLGMVGCWRVNDGNGALHVRIYVRPCPTPF